MWLILFFVVSLSACGGGGKGKKEAVPPLTTITPSAGAYASVQNVELSCNDGAGTGCGKIFFTLDGTEPTINSEIYSVPIEIDSNITIKFFAVDNAGNSESIHTSEYIIDTKAPEVSPSEAEGTYNDAINISLSCDDGLDGSGCDTIFYTTDGSDPTINSLEYTQAISIVGDTTLKYRAFDSVDNLSPVEIQIYKIKPIVGPYYASNGVQWNDYVNDDGLTQLSATDSLCSIENCLHAGELRQFLVPGGVCDKLTAKDNFNIFEWRCIVRENKSYFVSAGINNGKYLSDLIDWNESPPVWQALSVEVSDSSRKLFSTKEAAWWLNPIEEVSTQTVFNAEGTVYVLKANISSNINISTDKISFIIAPGVALTADSTNPSDLFSFNGNYLWIEGQFDGAELFKTSGIVNTGHHNMYSNVRVKNVSQYAIALNQKGGDVIEGHNRLRDIFVTNSATWGGSYYSINIDSPANILHNINASNNYEGILIGANARDNVLDNVTVANEALGLWLSNARNNILSNVTSTNSINQSLSLDTANFNLIINTFLANSNNSGISISGAGNSINNLISVNNDTGISIGAEKSIFTGILKVGANNKDCDVGTFNNPGLTNSCENQGSSDAHLSLNVTSSNSFIGKVTQDDMANSSETNGAADYNLISDWTYFQNQYRGWGKDGNAYPDSTHQYICIVGETCRIWDWSLAQNDEGDNGQSAALNVLEFPNGDNVVIHIWGGLDEVSCNNRQGAFWDAANSICKSNFLRNAVERLNDFNGNENGLCENNEICIYTPNIGAYQGHGEYISAGVFSDGIISGVTLLKRELNGR